MDNKNILFIIPMEEEHKKRVEKAAANSTFIYSNPKDVTEEMVKNADIIVGNVPPKFIGGSKKLQLLQLNSAGSDAYVKEGVLAKETILTSATGAYGQAVSEHMFSILLMLIKKLHLYRDNQNNCAWQDEGQVSALYGKNVVIVGLGDIGLSFARMCKAFGANVIGVKRTVGVSPENVDKVYSNSELKDVLPMADVVFSIVPSTNETRFMFNKETFDIMKDGVVFLNGGRGDAVKTEDLDEAVKSGKVAFAGLDVTYPEPLPQDAPIWKNRNVFITPHIAGQFHLPSTLERIREISMKNIENYFSGNELINKVKHE